MHESSKKYSKILAKIVARKAVGNLIDVGGGPGSYSPEDIFYTDFGIEIDTVLYSNNLHIL